jgi:endonuclease YncB( thermonuclease family)
MKKYFLFLILLIFTSSCLYSQTETTAICLEKNYDGDTVTVLMYVGQNIYIEKSCRLAWINTPEKATKNLLEKQAGIKVRDYLTKIILYKKLKIFVFEDIREKFGRPLVEIEVDGICINNEFVKIGFAKPYFGEKKPVWTDLELYKIINHEP